MSEIYHHAPVLSELNLRFKSRHGWDTRRNCPACDAPSITKFATIRHISYGRCQGCGFVFANPAPPESVATDFYNSKFYDNYRTLEEARIAEEKYFSISSYTDPMRLAGWLSEFDKSSSILDFGCGPASFLALLRDKFGFNNIEGLELNEKSAGIARRNYSIELTKDLPERKHEQYDAVILFEVIEHISKPHEVISLCSSLLKPGGMLFITTPSVRNIPARYFPAHCQHYTGPSHVSLFTETALAQLLKRYGLVIERLETDPATSILGHAVSKPFYNLDFASPTSRTDQNDLLYVPTAFGRAIGLKPSRSVGRILGKLRSIDRRIASAVAKMTERAYSDHLYALARKTPGDCRTFA